MIDKDTWYILQSENSTIKIAHATFFVCKL